MEGLLSTFWLFPPPKTLLLTSWSGVRLLGPDCTDREDMPFPTQVHSFICSVVGLFVTVHAPTCEHSHTAGSLQARAGTASLPHRSGCAHSAGAAARGEDGACLPGVRDITRRVGRESAMSKPPSTTRTHIKTPLHLKFRTHPSSLVSESG